MTATNTPTRLNRTPSLPTDETSSRRSFLTGLFCTLGAIALLVGVPVALILLVGNPFPTSAPSRDWLTADVNASLVIKVVAALVWIAWIHFVVCFLTEWRAIRRGRLPHRVVMGGGSQVLARQIVAGILLLAGGMSVAHGAAAGVGPQQVTGHATVSASVVAGMTPNPTTADKVTVAAADHPSAARKVTTIRPPEGRHHDTLWGVADRYLNDPLRWKEVYHLNKDRLQPDGSRLTDANLIRPGWQILLPADAHGPGVTTLPETPSHAGGPGADEPGVGVKAPAAAGLTRSADTVGADGHTTSEAAHATHSEHSSGLASILLGGGLIAAGIAAAMTARRGPYGEPDADQLALAAEARWRRSQFIDKALRSLAEQRRAADLPMPDVLQAYADDEQLMLHLMTSIEPPEAPWTATNEGRTWKLNAADVVEPGDGAPAPYPSLVVLARSHGYDVLVDLEMAPGLISLAGDTTVGRDVAMAMALDLCVHAWSDSVEVVLVGFGEDMVDLDNGRSRRVDDLEELLSSLDSRRDALASVTTQLGVTGVLQGRQRGATSEFAPTVLFLSGAPTSEQAQRLARLTDAARSPISIVCVGDSPSSRWRLIVESDGRLEAPVLGVSGQAHRIQVDAQRHLRTMIENADSSRERAADTLEETRPAELATDILGSIAPERAPVAIEDAGVVVRLLGPVTVDAPGDVSDERRRLLTEVVVMTALHPEGLHPEVMRASLWPRGVEDDVVRARIAEAQAWLGADGAGRPRLHTDDDGRLCLSDDVAVDYAVLARQAAAVGVVELDGIAKALDLGFGPVFSGAGERYHWLAFAREARQCRMLVTSMARRGSDLAISARRSDLAVTLLRQGLRLVPPAEPLWRELLRLTHDTDPENVGSVIDEMYSTLHLAGGRHEPETEALVTELAPDRDRVSG